MCDCNCNKPITYTTATSQWDDVKYVEWCDLKNSKHVEEEHEDKTTMLHTFEMEVARKERARAKWAAASQAVTESGQRLFNLYLDLNSEDSTFWAELAEHGELVIQEGKAKAELDEYKTIVSDLRAQFKV